MKTPANRKIKKYRISAKYRDYFTSNLSLLLGAAVPVQDAFESLKQTSKSSPLTNALTQMQADIDDGLPLWKVIDRSGVVSSQTLTLIKLGEESGHLIENLKIAAKQEEKQRAFKAKVRSAMIYPSFVLSLTLVVGIGVAWFLLPQLAETFSQLNVSLPFISLIFINAGLFLKENGLWAVPAFLSALAMLIYIVFFFPKTKQIGQWILFKIPGVSRLMHEVELARFGYLAGTLLQAGLSITQTFESLVGASNATPYKKLYAYLKDSFDAGYSFQNVLIEQAKATAVLPPQVKQMIIAGERSGSLPESLIAIGDIYEAKSDISTQNLEAIIEPMLLVVVWLGVMGVAVAVILPIYSLIGGLSA